MVPVLPLVPVYFSMTHNECLGIFNTQYSTITLVTGTIKTCDSDMCFSDLGHLQISLNRSLVCTETLF